MHRVSRSLATMISQHRLKIKLNSSNIKFRFLAYKNDKLAEQSKASGRWEKHWLDFPGRPFTCKSNVISVHVVLEKKHHWWTAGAHSIFHVREVCRVIIASFLMQSGTRIRGSVHLIELFDAIMLSLFYRAELL